MTLTAEDAGRLQECFLSDGVAVIPTDTVYGLACNPDSPAAVERLFELKQRPPRKPAAVMFFSLDPALELLSDLGPRVRAVLRALLPGPVTVLLANPQRRFALACGDGSDTRLGLRVPRFGGQLAPLANVQAPAMQSSANLSGGPDPRRLQDVPAKLREDTDLVLDGGELPGTASSVIDLSDYEQAGTWRIVREGALSAETLREVLS